MSACQKDFDINFTGTMDVDFKMADGFDIFSLGAFHVPKPAIGIFPIKRSLYRSNYAPVHRSHFNTSVELTRATLKTAQPFLF